MTTWHYRFLRYTDGTLALHEVYCDEEGRPNGYTTRPISFAVDADEGHDGLVQSMKMALGTPLSGPFSTFPIYRNRDGQPLHPPARQTHFNNSNQRAILFESDEGSAEIVRLWHGALHRLVTGAEHATLVGRPVASHPPVSAPVFA